tara:strand:+ start:1525 stop:1743 length:219 start_codon:yes stop_codon:yes gene_type:complete
MKIKNQILGVCLVAVLIVLTGCNPLIDLRDSADEVRDEAHEEETLLDEDSIEDETGFEEDDPDSKNHFGNPQ